MKWLRITIYRGDEPWNHVTTVLEESGLATDIHTAANAFREKLADRNADVEIFEHDGDWKSAGRVASKRARTVRSDKERHSDTTKDWAISMMRLAKDDGVISMKSPAPITAETIAEVFSVAAKHPYYIRQTIIGIGSDLKRVILKEGKVCVLGLHE